jgi:protein-S-isoprenylcysteine O-methyltransferase Ste14
MYVGVLTVLLGWAALFNAANLVLYALVVGTCFHLFIIRYEEPHLLAEFGTEYEAYRSRVARWLPRAWRRLAD